jgi:hypothetical protein
MGRRSEGLRKQFDVNRRGVYLPRVEVCQRKDYIAARRQGATGADIMYLPLNQETVNDTAKLIMHRLIARLLVREPLLVDQAKVSLTKMSAHFPDRSFISDWEKLLRLPTRELRALLTSRSEDMKRLRLSSPFVTAEGVDFTDHTLRRRIRRAAKRIAARASRPAGRDSQGTQPMAA